MKTIIRHLVIDTYALWLTSMVASGMVFSGGLKTLLFAGAMVSAVSIFAKPVINLLLLPLNLISFGLFRWVASAIVLYLVTLIVKDYKIVSFTFAGFSGKWFDIPAMDLHGILAFVAFSFIVSLITSSIYWLFK
jgi:putative membrane protein